MMYCYFNFHHNFNDQNERWFSWVQLDALVKVFKTIAAVRLMVIKQKHMMSHYTEFNALLGPCPERISMVSNHSNVLSDIERDCKSGGKVRVRSKFTFICCQETRAWYQCPCEWPHISHAPRIVKVTGWLPCKIGQLDLLMKSKYA